MKILSIVFAVTASVAIAIATAGCTLQAAPPHAPDSRELSIEQLVDIQELTTFVRRTLKIVGFTWERD